MSFRRYGGVTYNAKNNIVKSNYNTAANLSVTGDVGQDNSYITFLSDISGDLIFYGNIDISGNLDVSGNAHIFGNLDVSGNENLQGNLLVYGNEDLRGNLDVSGNTHIFKNLDVSGNENLQGNLLIYGNEDLRGNLDVSGNENLQGNLDVSGNENLQGNLLVYGTSYLTGIVYEPSGVTGATGSYSNIYVSGQSVLNGQVYEPSGVTGATGSYSNIYVSGDSILNGQVYEPSGVTGATGSYSNIYVSGDSILNGQVYEPSGVTGATGSYSNIYVSGDSILNGVVYTPSGVTGSTGWFNNLYARNNLQIDGNTILGNDSNDTINMFGTLGVTGPSNFYGLMSAPFGITGSSGRFENMDICGNLYGAYMYLTATGQTYSVYPGNSVVPKSYVDTIGSGLKPDGSAVCATTKSIDGPGGSSGDVNPYGIPTIDYTDGYQVADGDYVLVVCQNAAGSEFSSALYNGAWIVRNTSWERPAVGTFSTGTNSAGGFSFIQNGDTHDNDALVQISSPGIVGANNLQFTLLYQVKYEIGQGLNLKDNALNVDSSLNFINYLDSSSDPIVPNATGTLTIGSYSSKTIIGPTNASSYPVIIQPGLTGPTGSFTNISVSGPSILNGLITAPGGITGATGSFTNISVSGPFILNGLIRVPGGITGATGSFTNISVSGPSILNGLITAPGGITGATGSFTNVTIGPAIGPTGQYKNFVQFSDGSQMFTSKASDQLIPNLGINLTNFGTNWTITSAPSSVIWESSSISASGQYQTALSYGVGIYTSSNYGVTWTKNTSVPDNLNWFSVSMSSSGQYQTALIVNGAIYTSSNYGVTWTITSAPNNLNWDSVSVSSSGQYQTAAVSSSGGIYTSSNYGNTWTITSAPNNLNWETISMSSSGQYQVAAARNGSGIYTSSNYGNTWTITSAPTADWESISMSSSGQYQVAVAYNFGIYISSDYGKTWTITSAPILNVLWSSVSVSATGQYITASIYGGSIYISIDYGNTWTNLNNAPNNVNWESVSISSSGQYINASVNGGGIYISSLQLGNQWLYTSNGGIYYNGGNVGIGTNNPGSKLAVSGEITSTGLIRSNTALQNEASGVNQGYISITSQDGINYIQSGLNTSSGSSADLYFTTIFNTAQHMVLKADGKLGIGTTTPSSALDVRGIITASSSSVKGIMASGNGNFLSIECHNNDNTIKYPVVLAGYGGNVGVNNPTPNSTLDVVGTFNATGTSTTNGISNTGDITSTNTMFCRRTISTGITTMTSGYSIGAQKYAGFFEFIGVNSTNTAIRLAYIGNTAFNSTTGKATGALEIALENDTTGVSIIGGGLTSTGVITSSSKFEVRSNNGAEINTIIGSLDFFNNGVQASSIQSCVNIGGVANNGDLRFFTRLDFNIISERMIIDREGNVGIGTTIPGTKLDVNGTCKATTFIGNLSGNATTATNASNATNATNATNSYYASIGIYNASTICYPTFVASSGLGFRQLFIRDNTTPLTYNPGTGTLTSTIFTSGSDYRLKTNIQPLLNFRTIDHLKPVEYDLSGNTHDMGFIAHEVQEVLPFLVQGEKDGEIMQSLNYTGFIALLVKEVQDLKKKNKLLEERLERIEQILNK